MGQKYEEMTDAELDKLAAQLLNPNKCHSDNKDAIAPYWNDDLGYFSQTKDPYNWKKWNPTHPDSNQCERYLFPKIADKCSEIDLTYNSVHGIWIEIRGEGKVLNRIDWCQEINRTKVIACLEAWDKIKTSA